MLPHDMAERGHVSARPFSLKIELKDCRTSKKPEKTRYLAVTLIFRNRTPKKETPQRAHLDLLCRPGPSQLDLDGGSASAGMQDVARRFADGHEARVTGPGCDEFRVRFLQRDAPAPV
jgi:hypothetical protein